MPSVDTSASAVGFQEPCDISRYFVDLSTVTSGISADILLTRFWTIDKPSRNGAPA